MSATRFLFDEDEIVDNLVRHFWSFEVAQGTPLTACRTRARAALHGWVQDGLAVETVGDARRYDLNATINHVTARGLEGDPFWRAHVVEPHRASAARDLASPRPVRLRFRREVSFPDRPTGSRVMLSIPMPQEESTQRNVSVTSLADPIRVGAGVILARTVVGPSGTAALDVELRFEASTRRITVDPTRVMPAEPVGYLGAEEGFIQITPFVRDLAQRLARSNAWETVLAVWELCMESVKLGAMHHHDLDPVDPLRSLVELGWGDCLTRSALAVALLRACQLPARLVCGSFVDPLDLGRHYWAEVHVPPYDWIPFDLHAWLHAAGDRTDPVWSRVLLGNRPHHLVWNRLPSTSPELGVVMPTRWFASLSVAPSLTETRIHDLDSGRLVFRDVYELLGDDPMFTSMQ